MNSERQRGGGVASTAIIGSLASSSPRAIRAELMPTLSGFAPTTMRSDKTCIVVTRHATQVRLRQAMFHRARMIMRNAPKCRSRYDAWRARGHSYGRALRGVADQLFGVACVLLRR